MANQAQLWLIKSRRDNYNKCPICLISTLTASYICTPCYKKYPLTGDFDLWIYNQIKERINGSIK